MLAACTGQQHKIIIRPDPGQDRHHEPVDSLESWQIIETRSGPGETGIPEWARHYYGGSIRGLEDMDRYSGRYVFVGENRGENLNALQQWANAFTVQHDLPRLVAARVERKLVSSATLYPDDEYGQYFESLIKQVSNGEYPGAVKEDTFWVKRRMVPSSADDGLPQTAGPSELYVFLVLISIDDEMLQNQLREIMASIRTTVSPTRDQAAAISRVRQSFFVGF